MNVNLIRKHNFLIFIHSEKHLASCISTREIRANFTIKSAHLKFKLLNYSCDT